MKISRLLRIEERSISVKFRRKKRLLFSMRLDRLLAIVHTPS
jgi:hypothetical protein